jgi:exonuclease SbcD
MRILHTSDWHVGRTFKEHQLLEDQRAVGAWLAETVREAAIDVVVVAGDLFDRAVPSAEAVAVLDEALAGIRSAGARVVAISGNHDSAERVAFGSRAMAAGGLEVRGGPARVGEAVELADQHGPVRCYPVPFLSPFLTAGALGLAPGERSHQAVMQVAVERVRDDLAAHPGVRSVVVAHAFVAGGEPSDSEALLVGGAEHVGRDLFEGFDYVALGHLHRAQEWDGGRIAYSGSPLPYSFSEARQKSVRIVELGASGLVGVETVPVPVGRAVVTLRGTLDELLHRADLEVHTAKFVRAELTDPTMVAGAMDQLRRRFPYAASLAWLSLAAIGRPAHELATRTPAELVGEFLGQALAGTAGAAHHAVAAEALVAAQAELVGSARG